MERQLKNQLVTLAIVSVGMLWVAWTQFSEGDALAGWLAVIMFAVLTVNIGGILYRWKRYGQTELKARPVAGMIISVAFVVVGLIVSGWFAAHKQYGDLPMPIAWLTFGAYNAGRLSTDPTVREWWARATS